MKNPQKNDCENETCHRHLMIGISEYDKTYLVNFILLQKQEPIFTITKSLYQNANIKAQTSDDIQPLENYENSTLVSDDTLLSKQENNIDLIPQKNVTVAVIFVLYHKINFTSQKNCS